jgi:hypothetical protein
MRRKAFDLQLSSHCRSKGFKSGACGVCLAHRFYLETAQSAASKVPDRRFKPRKKTLWQGLNVPASAVPSQTASSESIVLRYFPL